MLQNHRLRGGLSRYLALAVVALAGFSSHAATPIESIEVSPDVTVELAFETTNDEAVVSDNMGGLTNPVNLGPLPPGTAVDAYFVLPNGNPGMSFDTTVRLPPGIVFGPADLVEYDGLEYSFAFSAAVAGLPAGVNIDAATLYPESSALLSFDTTVDIGGTTVDDEDLVFLNGSTLALHLDLSELGIDPSLDLDAVQYVECTGGTYLVSFDGAGIVDGLPFDDDDVLEYDPIEGGWEMAYDGEQEHPGWAAADLDAAHVTVELGPATTFPERIVFADKDEIGWSIPRKVLLARGPFKSHDDIGAYATDVVLDSTIPTTGFTDGTIPEDGLWYLVRPSSCVAGSWQTSLGAEPGRDAALP